jgi:hypothetical protein
MLHHLHFDLAVFPVSHRPFHCSLPNCFHLKVLYCGAVSPVFSSHINILL